MGYESYANPDEYLSAWTGWQLESVRELRSSVMTAASFDEVVKWGHLVYEHNGPVLLIRASDEWVRLGFWRGQRLLEMEPRLKPGGKYEMATAEYREGDQVDPHTVKALARRAWQLNDEFGDPRDAAKR